MCETRTTIISFPQLPSSPTARTAYFVSHGVRRRAYKKKKKSLPPDLPSPASPRSPSPASSGLPRAPQSAPPPCSSMPDTVVVSRLPPSSVHSRSGSRGGSPVPPLRMKEAAAERRAQHHLSAARPWRAGAAAAVTSRPRGRDRRRRCRLRHGVRAPPGPRRLRSPESPELRSPLRLLPLPAFLSRRSLLAGRRSWDSRLRREHQRREREDDGPCEGAGSIQRSRFSIDPSPQCIVLSSILVLIASTRRRTAHCGCS
ncbi:hypothetical protein PVAP13_7KG433750 [Panicum virgatum]|uniref:Uncharacterized protein n=1 Tax=Panicum virgatum TaxID=38727 RepID=A0A8T0QQQ9_PANVG|nr:hypothetical protein PVAP13_7KG433750 [Panicum virgatum]